METQQIVEHVISILLGGAGGIAAGVVRVASKLSAYEQKIADMERRLEQTTVKDNENVRQLELLKGQVDEKLNELGKEIAELRRTSMEHQTEVQRSLGAIEGTLNMLARNGCSRACTVAAPSSSLAARPSRSSISDAAFPVTEPPTRNRRP